MTTNTEIEVFTGIDLGCFHSVVSSSRKATPSAVVVNTNSLSNRSTPSMVGFDDKVRIVGEEAESRVTSIPDSIITHVPLLLGCDQETLHNRHKENHWRFQLADDRKVQLHFCDTPIEVPGTLITSILLKELIHSSQTTPPSPIHVTIAFSENDTSKEQLKKDLILSSKLTGVPKVSFISHTDAVTNCWLTKNFPSLIKDEFNNSPNPSIPIVIGFLDVGSLHSSLHFIQVEHEEMNITSVKKLTQHSLLNFGTTKLTSIIYQHVLEAIKAKHGISVTPTTKMGFRIKNACVRALKELSGLPNCRVDVEGIPDEDCTFTYEFSREKFEELARKEMGEFALRIEEILKEVRSQYDAEGKKENVDYKFMGIECIGGGSRIPFVYRTVNRLCSSLIDDHSHPRHNNFVRRTLDSNSAVSVGAALFSAGVRHVGGLFEEDEYELSGLMEGEELDALREQMNGFDKVESAELERRAEKNNLETAIFEMQAELNGRYKHILTRTKKVEELLSAADEWFLNACPFDTTKEDYQNKREELLNGIYKECPDYLEQKNEDKKRVERELEENAKNAKESEVKEDHDRRALPHSQRISLANKNKDEGNELFKGKNYEHAIDRYIKAIGHIKKMVEPVPPVEKQTGEEILLATYNNLAMTWLKLETERGYNKCVDATTDALSIDKGNVKALYRRAYALYMLKNYDKALEDLNDILRREKEHEEAKKLHAAVMAIIKKQQEKEKKMYGKMFG